MNSAASAGNFIFDAGMRDALSQLSVALRCRPPNNSPRETKNEHSNQTALCCGARRLRPCCRFPGAGTDLTGMQRQVPGRQEGRLNSSHLGISYAVFCLKKKNKK